MAQVAVQVVEGKVRYNGRTLAEWVPEVIADVVAACDPLQIILFGSVARGDDGPDSDIDLLVVLTQVDKATRHKLMGRIRFSIGAPVPIDVFVTDPQEIAQRRDVIGSMLCWPMREGRIVYDRAV
ncbi:MAG: nucleotidyltransferase domain-containing protein [Egibacteraceae bacterium]